MKMIMSPAKWVLSFVKQVFTPFTPAVEAAKKAALSGNVIDTARGGLDATWLTARPFLAPVASAADSARKTMESTEAAPFAKNAVNIVVAPVRTVLSSPLLRVVAVGAVIYYWFL